MRVLRNDWEWGGGSPGWACSAPSLDFWLALAVAHGATPGSPVEEPPVSLWDAQPMLFFPPGGEKKAPNYSVLAGMG